MACPCDPVVAASSVSCCILSDSSPSSRQYVRFARRGTASPGQVIPAFALTINTPTALNVSGQQRFWVQWLQLSLDIDGDDARVFWGVGTNVDAVNSYLIRVDHSVNGVFTYNGPGVPLPLGADLYVTTAEIVVSSIVGYGFLETI